MVRAWRFAAVVAALLAGTGCVVEGALEPGGGGRVRVRYRLVSTGHFEPGKTQLQSADVRLVHADMTPEKWATFDLAFDDARRLPTAPALSRTTVELRDEPDGLRTLAVQLADLSELPAPCVQYLGGELRVSIALPGEVVRSNAAAVAGRTASWSVPLAAREPMRLEATFRPAAG